MVMNFWRPLTMHLTTKVFRPDGMIRRPKPFSFSSQTQETFGPGDKRSMVRLVRFAIFIPPSICKKLLLRKNRYCRATESLPQSRSINEKQAVFRSRTATGAHQNRRQIHAFSIENPAGLDCYKVATAWRKERSIARIRGKKSRRQ
jgi:hypothetical protein